MAKMGWEPGKGLGLNENGITEHVAVKLKDNLHGIGADKKAIDNWIDKSVGFDQLLKELNERLTTENSPSVNEDEGKKKEKKRKKEKEKDGKKKKRKTSKEEEMVVKSNSSSSIRNPHRQKFRRNKSVRNYDPQQLAEIFGIRTSATVTPIPESSVSSKETSVEPEATVVVSQMSTQEYFAMKLKGKQLNGLASSNTHVNRDPYDDEEDVAVIGLGYDSKESEKKKKNGR